MITRREGREPRIAGICHFSESLVCLSLSQNLESSNVANSPGLQRKLPIVSEPTCAALWPGSLLGFEGHRAGVARAIAASEAAGRGAVPRSCLSPLASRSSDADLGTRARGGDLVTRLLRLGSPRGQRAGKSRARVQERGARPGGRPGRWRSAPAMSQGLQLLLLGCGTAPSPSPPRCLRLRLGGLAYAALSLPLSYSLQPGSRDGDAGGDGGLLRDRGPAMHSALGPTALLQGVLGQGKRGGLSGFLVGTTEADSQGPLLRPRVGDSSYSDTPPSSTGLHLHPHPELKPLYVNS